MQSGTNQRFFGRIWRSDRGCMYPYSSFAVWNSDLELEKLLSRPQRKQRQHQYQKRDFGTVRGRFLSSFAESADK